MPYVTVRKLWRKGQPKPAQRLVHTRKPAKGQATYTRKANLTAMVKKIVNRQEETKYVSEIVQDHKNHNPSIYASGDMFNVIPQVKQGTDDFQRIGRVIKPVKGFVDVHLSYTPTGIEGGAVQTAQSIYAVLYHVTNRTWKNYPSIPTAPGIFGGLLDLGNGQSTYFSGDILDLQRPVNKDNFRLVKKYVVKLTRNVGFTQGDAVAGNSPNMPSHSGYVRIPLKRMPMLRFDPGIGATGQFDYPVNYSPVIGVGYCFADGTPQTAATQEQTLLQVTATAHLWFKDA